mmetsp:Transcript_33015/g.49878  ORF Transcript_33015/g.49878 Transcript_33015/m.49878 type:complete len:342 (-) Transcript_33015:224-1249(-)
MVVATSSKRKCVMFFLLLLWNDLLGGIICSPPAVKMDQIGHIMESLKQNIRLGEVLDSLQQNFHHKGRVYDTIGFYYGLSTNIIKKTIATVDETSSEKSKHYSKRKEEDRRKHDFEIIGEKVENWAKDILQQDSNSRNGWTEIECVRSKAFQVDQLKTKQYVKWMPDSRFATPPDQQNHPCMRLHAVLDVPFPIVCRYLSQHHRLKEYNSLLVDQSDVEVLTPHSKVCWSQSKKLLFIEPRDFITFCSHRWLKDGAQLVVSQACDHPKYPYTPGVTLRAYNLRAATYLIPSKGKTEIIMLAHCNCGKDLPEWAVRAAVKVLANRLKLFIESMLVSLPPEKN